MARRPISNTCIAVTKTKKGKLAIAADRRVSWGFDQAQVMANPKVLKRGGLILAGTGDCFLCDLIVRDVPIPTIYTYNPEEYLKTAFYDAIIKQLRRNHMMHKEDGIKIPPECSAEIVVALARRAFCINICNPAPEKEHMGGLVAITEVAIPYATGCGGQWAWSSLLTTATLGVLNTKDRLKLALQIAGKQSPGCDTNIDIVVED